MSTLYRYSFFLGIVLLAPWTSAAEKEELSPDKKIAAAKEEADFPEKTIVAIEMAGDINNSSWHMMVVKSDVVFWPEWRIEKPGAKRIRSHFPKYCVLFFYRDGAMLRLKVKKDHLRIMATKKKAGTPEHSKEDPIAKEIQEIIDKDGWYLSGNYSTDPPRVVLTKKPTKYSRWSFLKTPKYYGSDGYSCFFKNENDLGKEAWLYFEEKGTRDKKGIELHKAILSPKKKVPYYLQDVNSGK
jgi:hypothetical protein